MDVFDFITQHELDDLPDDDPQSAFVIFVRTASRKLALRLKSLDAEENAWREITEARQSFMNVVVAAAKRFQIDPFSSMEVKRLRDFDDDNDKRRYPLRAVILIDSIHARFTPKATQLPRSSGMSRRAKTAAV